MRTIAVVEDDDSIRELVENVLVSGGYQVFSTARPEEAVDLVKRERPDLVLCDIAMPRLDGYGVLKALQADPETARAPVVFLTAHHEFSERVRAFRFGVVDYVTKPFTRAILLRKVEKVLEELDQRAGVVDAGAPAALLDEVRQQSRTGVLTVRGEGGEERVFLKTGEVVARTGTPVEAGGHAEFTELDAAREDIVAHDPPALPPSSADRLPAFEDIPDVLRSVLVVDDNRVFRHFLRDLLGGHGFTVYEAAGTDEALKVALEKRPWLILTDVRMPGEDGFAFCRRVREHTLLRQTPLLFLSGWDDYKARDHALELGADDFLSKETPVRELLIRMQVTLKRHVVSGGRRPGPGMQGQLQVMGAPGVLQTCHLMRMTGSLVVEDGKRRVSVRFRDGEILSAEGDGETGAEAVFRMLGWESGTFRFVPGDPGPGEPVGPFSQLILEGCRRLDESRREPDGPAETTPG
ncbi:MAG TPA: response regulator [Vicinamibacteria bacterium]|nr:response regulator [Vicinamibacteria bacterium]